MDKPNNLSIIRDCTNALQNLRISDFKDDKTINQIARLRKVLIDVTSLIKLKKMPMDL